MGGKPADGARDRDVMLVFSFTGKNPKHRQPGSGVQGQLAASHSAHIPRERWAAGKEGATQGTAFIENGVLRCVHVGHLAKMLRKLVPREARGNFSGPSYVRFVSLNVCAFSLPMKYL